MGIAGALRLEECLRLSLCAKVATITVEHQWSAMGNGGLRAMRGESKDRHEQSCGQQEPHTSAVPRSSSPKQPSLCHAGNLLPGKLTNR
jgi:hypothetical protein